MRSVVSVSRPSRPYTRSNVGSGRRKPPPTTRRSQFSIRPRRCSHEYSFDIGSRELLLAVTIPDPTAVPDVKEYRYVKARDEIVSTALPARECKERYANAVWQVALRTLHEIFEADRASKISSIALTVGVSRFAPATGRPETVPLAVVAADRGTFTSFDLVNVVPQATLVHMGAALSKSPFDLAPADTSVGVRVRER